VDDDAISVHDADVCLFHRDVQSGIIFHGQPPLLLIRKAYRIPERSRQPLPDVEKLEK
jgi:hypothetical protein